jgi:hypothetical protein
MPFFANLGRSVHWSLRLSRALFVSWFLLISCLLFPFIRGRAGLGDEISAIVALVSLALSFYGALLWLVLFVVAVITRRGRVGGYMWFQAIALVGLALFAGSVIYHP